MNLCVCKGLPDMKIADSIELISADPFVKHSLENLAKAAGTIVYECLVRLDRNMRREIV